MGAAYALARAGWDDVTVVERGSELGGLAGAVRRGEHVYPLAYHHILHRDRALLFTLDAVGALERVRWRRIRMLFRLGGRFHDLARPTDFLRFPMSLADKLRFTRLMLRCFNTSDWSAWQGAGADALIDAWGGPGVRAALFEPLCRLKFDLPCAEVSAAWLGARLHFREGSAALGYVPDTTWTELLCRGLAGLLERGGVRALTSTRVRALEHEGSALRGVTLDDGRTLRPDVVVSALPTEVYRDLAGDTSAELATIRYTAILSALCVTRQTVRPDFYWLNLPELDRQAGGLFRLESLNPTIGAPGETCLNFVTHVPSRDAELFRRDDADLLRGYLDDFRAIFGFELSPEWTRLTRLPMYSPVFRRGYANPPVRSAMLRNVYFAGNYRTFPSIASTGTALASGFEAAAAVLGDHGARSDLGERISAFRLRAQPRG